MLFNSVEFLLFLPVVFLLYWFVCGKSLRIQNVLLLVTSYVFYGWWDWRFLSLIFLSTVVDFISGIRIDAAPLQKTKKIWLTFSMVFNLGLLGFFKYYNFFVGSWIELFSQMGIYMDPWTMNIVLPVGISFYTFQTMSYSLDIYYERLKPTTNFVNFAAFVSFFPQLVAGPIERASNLLPQIEKRRTFSSAKAIEGIEQILWGFFKKVVIADALAGMVSEVYGSHEEYNSLSLIVAAIAFSFQIYGDFSGYSDIAIGTAKLFGIDLMSNFNFPYLSRNIGEFWRRWHISLSTWFRDYVYYPLGGSRVRSSVAIRNVFVVFLTSGLWHGANWTFLAWGGIHALLFIPSFVLNSNSKYKADLVSGTKLLPGVIDTLKVALTFSVVTLAWVFFRSESVLGAVGYIKGVFSSTGGRLLVIPNNQIITLVFSFSAFFFFSWIYLYRKNEVIKSGERAAFLTSLALLILICLFGEFSKQSFIYFQF
ncbi:MBOAT family O-acyltransferase [uncultured Imperialibacter sp.]|uniref:MBOAT family O-acyltransferase n=1 Tax=uncultured Imperialibacter sp. TaxID=1672639 RepID=UPI0030D9B697|tara:strand:- start:2711 stop:4150 length:1440 start_codon:yes stop_codon:yes gene_type:complete